MRTLADAVRTRLRSALEGTGVGEEALVFVEAVIVQRAYPLGESADASATAEGRIAEQVVRLIEESVGGELALARAAQELADDPALLASFFQHLDLLPVEGGPSIDGVMLVVGAALQRLTETLSDR